MVMLKVDNERKLFGVSLFLPSLLLLHLPGHLAKLSPLYLLKRQIHSQSLSTLFR